MPSRTARLSTRATRRAPGGRCGRPSSITRPLAARSAAQIRAGRSRGALPRRPGSAPPRPAAAPRAGATGSTRRCPTGPGSGLAVTPATPRPSCRPRPATPATAAPAAPGPGPRRRPTRSRADLELRLDHAARSPRRGAAQAARAGSTSVREMKESRPRPGRAARHLLRRQAADVDPVQDGDPVVGPQRPGQLAVTDVNGHHVRRTRAQQHVGEAAGGRARVQAALARDREAAECGQRPGQLVAAARDVVGPVAGLRDGDRRVTGDLRGGLGRDLARDATRPAAIRSAAWSRDLARPRRTSSASSRSLLLIGPTSAPQPRPGREARIPARPAPR